MNNTIWQPDTRIAFIGGGNMASAIIGGLLASGLPASAISVVEPLEAARTRLAALGVQALPEAGDALRGATLLVWAVKPQHFAAAAAPVAPHIGGAVQLSLMAGVPCAAIAAATGSKRIVRCMPNMPALIARGATGAFSALAGDARALAERVLATVGDVLWVEKEELLDAVTALSGSGPAYVFYFLEAMQRAGESLGLTGEQARQLAISTFEGSALLAQQATEKGDLAALRERVTSKGGTTQAALDVLRAAEVAGHFERAMHAAHQRAQELGRAAPQ